MRAEKFKDDTGWHLRLVADDGGELLVSEAFENKTDANRAGGKLHDALGVKVTEAKG